MGSLGACEGAAELTRVLVEAGVGNDPFVRRQRAAQEYPLDPPVGAVEPGLESGTAVYGAPVVDDQRFPDRSVTPSAAAVNAAFSSASAMAPSGDSGVMLCW